MQTMLPLSASRREWPVTSGVVYVEAEHTGIDSLTDSSIVHIFLSSIVAKVSRLTTQSLSGTNWRSKLTKSKW